MGPSLNYPLPQAQPLIWASLPTEFSLLNVCTLAPACTSSTLTQRWTHRLLCHVSWSSVRRPLLSSTHRLTADRIHFHADAFRASPREPRLITQLSAGISRQSLNTSKTTLGVSPPWLLSHSQSGLPVAHSLQQTLPTAIWFTAAASALVSPFHPDQILSLSPSPPQSILHTAVPAILLACKSDQILLCPISPKTPSSFTAFTHLQGLTQFTAISLSILSSRFHLITLTPSWCLNSQICTHSATPLVSLCTGWSSDWNTLPESCMASLISVKSLPNTIPDHRSAHLVCCSPPLHLAPLFCTDTY